MSAAHSSSIHSLLHIMARLRDPVDGCPWDLQQDFRSIAPYTLEEAYEVVDAIETGRPDDLRAELGDLLFQVVFHAQMASENNQFDMEFSMPIYTPKSLDERVVFQPDTTKNYTLLIKTPE